MIRIDGKFTIFVLQGRKTKSKTDTWFSPSFDSFGTPSDFSASGDCWQKLGIHGTFEEEAGLSALARFAKAYPEYDWRLMKLDLSQTHTEFASMSARRPGKAYDKPYLTTDEHRRRIQIVQGKE